jgi:hypothetical protein
MILRTAISGFVSSEWTEAMMIERFVGSTWSTIDYDPAQSGRCHACLCGISRMTLASDSFFYIAIIFSLSRQLVHTDRGSRQGNPYISLRNKRICHSTPRRNNVARHLEVLGGLRHVEFEQGSVSVR